MKPPTDPAGLKTASAVAGDQSAEYAPYPKIDPADVRQPPPPPPSSSSPKSVTWSSDLVQESPPPPPPTMRNETGHKATSMPAEGNPYVTPSPASSSSKITMDSVKNVLGRWGKKLEETAKKTEDLAGNVWQHLKTGPSFADAAMGRIAQGTKIIAEGGYEKIFRQSFDTYPEEQLKSSYACYLSTSAGPVMGSLYLSTAKLAFCSDNPLSYTIEDKTEWSYYKILAPFGTAVSVMNTVVTNRHPLRSRSRPLRSLGEVLRSRTTVRKHYVHDLRYSMVVIPLHQLRVVNPSTSKVNPAEKYIQIVSVDNHEFWFMGFLYYDSAVKHIQEAFTAPDQYQP